MSITDFNFNFDFILTYLTPLLERLNKEDKLSFLMGEFNIDLMKKGIKFNNSQFYNIVL